MHLDTAMDLRYNERMSLGTDLARLLRIPSGLLRER
jgi:hypothetical protein